MHLIHYTLHVRFYKLYLYPYICIHVYIIFKSHRLFFSHEKEGNSAVYNNLNEARRNMLSEGSQAEKDKCLQYITCMWNLKELNPEKQNSMVAGGASARDGEWGDTGQRVQTSGYKINSCEELMFSMVIINNNTVVYTWKLLRE